MLYLHDLEYIRFFINATTLALRHILGEMAVPFHLAISKVTPKESNGLQHLGCITKLFATLTRVVDVKTSVCPFGAAKILVPVP